METDSPRAESPSDRSTDSQTNVIGSAPSLYQAGHMAMLLAIFLSVGPGIDASSGALAVALIGIILYAMETFGGVYDFLTAAVREVRS